jgi:hypothetical protein
MTLVSRGIGLTAVIFAGCLAASVSSTHACPTARSSSNARSPSNFDYLVLASIADSPRLATMAAYRPDAVKSMDK